MVQNWTAKKKTDPQDPAPFKVPHIPFKVPSFIFIYVDGQYEENTFVFSHDA